MGQVRRRAPAHADVRGFGTDDLLAADRRVAAAERGEMAPEMVDDLISLLP